MALVTVAARAGASGRAAVLAALAFAATAALAAPAKANPPLVVPIASCAARAATVTGFVGDFPGGVAGKMRQFYDIPFAAPPVGPLRWQPPKAHCWSGTIANTAATPEPVCSKPGDSTTKEDCLYLNIYTEPTGTVTKRPVMVWIHGGGHVSGSARNAGHNPVALVKQGVVVVSINYRLGVFGLLAHPALDTSASNTGNYWFYDQIAALKWIKANIAGFGGDPANVTIFGQSAGGMSTLIHLVSPLSKGLFHKAIIQSGSYYEAPTPLATAESTGSSYAASVGCPGSGAAAAQCLRTLDAQTLTAKQDMLGKYMSLIKIDGVVLPDTIPKLLSAGKFQTVPVMNGTTHDEIRYHLVGDSRFGTGDSCHFTSTVTASNYMDSLKVFFGQYASYDASFYPTPKTALAANTTFTSMRTDGAMACSALMMDKWFAAKNAVYAYEFSDANAPNTATGPVALAGGGAFPLGAYHVGDLQYIFPRRGTVACGLPYKGLTLAQKTLAAAMVGYWTSFAKTGNPNPSGAGLPAWPRYTGTSATMLSLAAGAPKPISAASFDTFHKCSALWGPVVSQ